MAMVRPPASRVLGGPADRGDDVLVAGAAADAAGDRGADLLLGGVRVLVQQRRGPSSASPACRSRTAARASRGSPAAPGRARPSASSDSTVRISWPSHIAASVVHDFTGLPSISTTQAPQLDVSQPQCVPVRPGVSRMKCTSSMRGSTSRETCWPLMLIETCIGQASWLRARAVARLQGALGQHAREVALVVDRPAAVGHRGAVLGGDLARLREQLLRRRLAPQQLLGAREVDRGEADGAQRDARRSAMRGAIHPDGRRRRRDRPVARAPLDLLVRAARAREQRQPDLGEQLAVADGGHVRAHVEVVHRHRALAVWCRGSPPWPSPPSRRRTGPRPRRPGRASRRSCRGCAPPGRRSPPRRRGRAGSARRAGRTSAGRRAG